MRRFFNGLIIGIILGAVGYWYVQDKVRQHPAAEQRAEQSAAEARTNAGEAAGHFSDAFKAKMEALDLRADQIKDELASSGKVFRRKASDFGEKVADAAADTRTVAAIKASYATDKNLSVWDISVSCSAGHVTLSGTVKSPDDIGRAVALAMDAPGTRDVVSTIQVKPGS
jgi:hypothetical protein